MSRLRTYQVTLGAGATQAVTPVTGHRTPVLEVGIDPPAHATKFGDSTLSSTVFSGIILASGAGIQGMKIGGSSGGSTVFVLEELYFLGTQNDVISFYAITL